MAQLVVLFALLVNAALANTEKAIFLAPAAISLPDAAPTLDTLQLDTISPSNSTLRTPLPVAFPSENSPQGLESWFLLKGLNAGQRYELRVCWAAVVCVSVSLEPSSYLQALLHQATAIVLAACPG